MASTTADGHPRNAAKNSGGPKAQVQPTPTTSSPTQLEGLPGAYCGKILFWETFSFVAILPGLTPVQANMDGKYYVYGLDL